MKKTKKFILQPSSKSKFVYFKDGTYITVDDGVTWEYENDVNWLKTVPILDVIMDFFKKVCKP